MGILKELDELKKAKDEIKARNERKAKEDAERAKRLKGTVKESAENIGKKVNSGLNKLWGIEDAKTENKSKKSKA